MVYRPQHQRYLWVKDAAPLAAAIVHTHPFAQQGPAAGRGNWSHGPARSRYILLDEIVPKQVPDTRRQFGRPIVSPLCVVNLEALVSQL